MAQVLRVTDQGQRNAIQAFTRAQCFPDYVTFVQDANGDWVTDLNVLTDLKFNRPGNKAQVIDKLTQFGDVIEWVPPIDDVIEGARPGQGNGRP